MGISESANRFWSFPEKDPTPQKLKILEKRFEKEAKSHILVGATPLTRRRRMYTQPTQNPVAEDFYMVVAMGTRY